MRKSPNEAIADIFARLKAEQDIGQLKSVSLRLAGIQSRLPWEMIDRLLLEWWRGLPDEKQDRPEGEVVAMLKGMVKAVKRPIFVDMPCEFDKASILFREADIPVGYMYDMKLRAALVFCAVLQDVVGDQPIRLARDMLAFVIRCSPRSASNYLAALLKRRVDGVLALELIKPSHHRIAAHYRCHVRPVYGKSFTPPRPRKANGDGLAHAIKFLTEYLAGGERKARDVEATARRRKIAETTLKRAKAQLQIASRKVGSSWLWSLPPHEQPQILRMAM